MALVFTDYPDISEDFLEPEEKIESKKIKKLKKKIKKQKKTIRKMKGRKTVGDREEKSEKRETADESKEASEKNETGKSWGKSFLTRVGEVFLKTLPSILRTATKIVVSALCGRAFKLFKKARVA